MNNSLNKNLKEYEKLRSRYVYIARLVIKTAVMDARGRNLIYKADAIRFLSNLKKKRSYENLIYELAQIGQSEIEKIEKIVGIKIEE